MSAPFTHLPGFDPVTGAWPPKAKVALDRDYAPRSGELAVATRAAAFTFPNNAASTWLDVPGLAVTVDVEDTPVMLEAWLGMAEAANMGSGESSIFDARILDATNNRTLAILRRRAMDWWPESVLGLLLARLPAGTGTVAARIQVRSVYNSNSSASTTALNPASLQNTLHLVARES